MSDNRIQTTQNVRIDLHFAGLGDRLLAYLIDAVVLFAYFFILSLLIGALGVGLFSNGSATDETTGWAVGVLVLVLFLPAAFYHLLCEVFLEGQSLGKRQMKIKVIKLDGSPPTLGAYLIRWIMRLVDISLTSGAVAVLVILVNGRGQRLGDLAAGTAVISLRPRTAGGRTLAIATDDNHEVIFQQALRLTDADIALIRETLAYYRDTGNAAPIAQLADKIRDRLGTDHGLKPTSFLYRVVKDYDALASRL